MVVETENAPNKTMVLFTQSGLWSHDVLRSNWSSRLEARKFETLSALIE